MSVIRIAAGRGCGSIGTAAGLEASRFISRCLSVKGTSSPASSAFRLGVWGIVSGVEALELIAVCGDVAIPVDAAVVLNVIGP